MPETPHASDRLRRPSDEGSGSVLTLAVAGAVVVLAVALGLCAQAAATRASAQSVADLSALAAARQAQRAAFDEPGATDPCTRAKDVAVRNGGLVVRCVERSAGVVEVEATVRAPVGEVLATARAGPRPP